jgi:hypothetical protein
MLYEIIKPHPAGLVGDASSHAARSTVELKTTKMSKRSVCSHASYVLSKSTMLPNFGGWIGTMIAIV